MRALSIKACMKAMKSVGIASLKALNPKIHHKFTDL